MARLSVDRSDWPVHQPECFDAPIPGRQWYGGCDDGYARVNPATGCCEECGAAACGECGRENCPDHEPPVRLSEARLEKLRSALTDEMMATCDRLGIGSHERCVIATRAMVAAEKALAS